MSDAEWTQVLDDLDTMLGDSTSGAGSTLYQAFRDGYDEDMTILHLAAWNISNDDEIRDYINQAKDDAHAAAVTIGTLWRTRLRPDVAGMNLLNTISEAWTDDVHEPIHNEPQLVRDSGLLRTWYGPGAQKYATAVMAQAAAMDEFNGMVQTAASGMKETANLVKNLALVTLHSFQPVYDKLSGWPDHGYGDELDPDMIFGERTGYAKGAFEGLRDWLQGMLDGAEWKNQTDQIRTSFTDAKVQTTSFKANTWPKAVTDGLDDMKNGDGGLGDQTQQGAPPATPAPPATSTEPDPTAPGTTTVDDDGKVTTQGGGSTPGGQDQYEGPGETGGINSGGEEQTQNSNDKYGDYSWTGF